MTGIKATVFNAVGYEVVWFILIIGSGWGVIGFPVLVLVPFLLLHGWLMKPCAAEWRFLGLAGIYGFLLDTLLGLAGVMQYGSAAPFPWMCPAWLVAVWVSFAATFYHSLSVLDHKPFIAMCVGLIGGPLAYYGGAKISGGQIILPEAPLISLVVLAIVWGITVPLLFKIKQSTTPRPL